MGLEMIIDTIEVDQIESYLARLEGVKISDMIMILNCQQNPSSVKPGL
jgi:hypothetical protein